MRSKINAQKLMGIILAAVICRSLNAASWDSDEDLIPDTEEQQLLEKYRPWFFYDRQETVWPCSATWFVQHSSLIHVPGGDIPQAVLMHDPGQITNHGALWSPGNASSGQKLNIDDNFRTGQFPDNPIQSVSVPVYGDVAPLPEDWAYVGFPHDRLLKGRVLVQYWLLFPYNDAHKWDDYEQWFLGTHGIGDHEGDIVWVDLILGDNNVPLFVVYHHHGDKRLGGPTVVTWDEVEKRDGAPIVYIEAGVHEFWPKAGEEGGFTSPIHSHLGDGVKLRPEFLNLGQAGSPAQQSNPNDLLDVTLFLQFNGEWGDFTGQGLGFDDITNPGGPLGQSNPAMRNGNSFPIDFHLLSPFGPWIWCSDVTKVADPGKCSAVVDFLVAATRTTQPSDHDLLPVTSVPPSGSEFPVGKTIVRNTVTDAFGRSNSCSFWVTVLNKEPPGISAESVSPAVLWPPDNSMVDVTINYQVTSNCQDVFTRISVVSCNEASNGADDDSLSPDWIIMDPHHVKLRATHAELGTGRVYTVRVTAADGSGNVSWRDVSVQVPTSPNGNPTASQQGFLNLDFESTFIRQGEQLLYGEPGQILVGNTAALPGWSAFGSDYFSGFRGLSGPSYTSVDKLWWNIEPTGGVNENPGTSIQDYGSSFGPPLQGDYMLALYACTFNQGGGTAGLRWGSIAQTGLIPVETRSLHFKLGGDGLSLMLAGTNIPYGTLYSNGNYRECAADISGFAGKIVELRFVAEGEVSFDSVGEVSYLDGIRFSTVPAGANLNAGYTFSTLAGRAGSSGSVDGMGLDARFNTPTGAAVDGGGNLYLTDTYNNTIRKVTSAGLVTTLAGLAGSSGSADGVGTNARFDHPFGAAVDTVGNVYVTDFGATIRKVTPSGAVTTLAGLAGHSGSADGAGVNARFNYPAGVAVDNAGNVYVSEIRNNTIRKVTPAGVVTTLAGLAGTFGSTDGMGTDARFNQPFGVAVDSTGNVFVTDIANNTIRKVSPSGGVTTLAGLAGTAGSVDGVGANARFRQPYAVAVSSTGDLFVTSDNTIRKVTPAGVVTTLAGRAGSSDNADGVGVDARFKGPAGVAVDTAGNIYVADNLDNTIRKGVAPPKIAGSPTLSISLSDGNLILSWPSSAKGFMLQQNSHLVVTNWIQLTVPTSTINGQINMILPITTEQKIFRLKSL